jgi:hypothetical protein
MHDLNIVLNFISENQLISISFGLSENDSFAWAISILASTINYKKIS